MEEVRREIAYIDTESGKMVLLYHGVGKELTAESLDGKIVEEIGYTPRGSHAFTNAVIFCRKSYIMPNWHYQEC